MITLVALVMLAQVNPEVSHPQALAARRKYEAAVEAARVQYDRELAAVVREVTKRGDLRQANAIEAWRKDADRVSVAGTWVVRGSPSESITIAPDGQAYNPQGQKLNRFFPLGKDVWTHFSPDAPLHTIWKIRADGTVESSVFIRSKAPATILSR